MEPPPVRLRCDAGWPSASFLLWAAPGIAQQMCRESIRRPFLSSRPPSLANHSVFPRLGSYPAYHLVVLALTGFPPLASCLSRPLSSPPTRIGVARLVSLLHSFTNPRACLRRGLPPSAVPVVLSLHRGRSGRSARAEYLFGEPPYFFRPVPPVLPF